MHDKTKMETVFHGTGFIKDITGLVSVILEGFNRFFEILLSKGRWLLFVVFVVSTVPFLMTPEIREWMSVNMRWLVTEIATNQRRLIQVQSQADQQLELIAAHNARKHAVLNAHIAELNARLNWMSNMSNANAQPLQKEGSVEVNEWRNKSLCHERKPNQFSFDDGCEYGKRQF